MTMRPLASCHLACTGTITGKRLLRRWSFFGGGGEGMVSSTRRFLREKSSASSILGRESKKAPVFDSSLGKLRRRKRSQARELLRVEILKETRVGRERQVQVRCADRTQETQAWPPSSTRLMSALGGSVDATDTLFHRPQIARPSQNRDARWTQWMSGKTCRKGCRIPDWVSRFGRRQRAET